MWIQDVTTFDGYWLFCLPVNHMSKFFHTPGVGEVTISTMFSCKKCPRKLGQKWGSPLISIMEVERLGQPRHSSHCHWLGGDGSPESLVLFNFSHSLVCLLLSSTEHLVLCSSRGKALVGLFSAWNNCFNTGITCLTLPWDTILILDYYLVQLFQTVTSHSHVLLCIIWIEKDLFWIYLNAFLAKITFKLH